MKMRNLELSLWFSSGAETVVEGGVEVDDMLTETRGLSTARVKNDEGRSMSGLSARVSCLIWCARGVPEVCQRGQDAGGDGGDERRKDGGSESERQREA